MKQKTLCVLLGIVPTILFPAHAVTLVSQYDDLGRLTSFSIGGEDSVGYTYDDSGNLIVQTIQADGPTATPTPTQGEEMTPTPCSPFDFSADCAIDANDLLTLLEQSDNVEDLFEFSAIWQEDLLAR